MSKFYAEKKSVPKFVALGKPAGEFPTAKTFI